MSQENRVTDVIGILALISSTTILVVLYPYLLMTDNKPAYPFVTYLLMAHAVGFFSTLFLHQIANILKAPCKEGRRLLGIGTGNRASIALACWFYLVVSGAGIAGIYLLANAPSHWLVFTVVLLGSFLAGEFTAPSRRRYLKDHGALNDAA